MGLRRSRRRSRGLSSYPRQQPFFRKPYLRQCRTASSHGMKAFSATTAKTRAGPTSVVEHPSDWRLQFPTVKHLVAFGLGGSRRYETSALGHKLTLQ